jgi:hypothetical protein
VLLGVWFVLVTEDEFVPRVEELRLLGALLLPIPVVD